MLPSSLFIMKILVEPLFSSISVWVTVKTEYLPSGDTTGFPMRFIDHIFSAVIGSFSGVNAPAFWKIKTINRLIVNNFEIFNTICFMIKRLKLSDKFKVFDN